MDEGTVEIPTEDTQNPVVAENAAEDEEEEDECRVCRGPAEEDRPLYKPCKCSGSIGLTHQDCLMSWLEVTRGDGRCELCKTKFRFDPQYAENAPDRLPAHEVLLGLTSRAVARWLPLAFRISVAILVWLFVAPMLTACLYHGWIHRPSSVLTRWKREIIPSDIVSGAIIAAVVIISFLSLMSFADFLRVHWQQGPRRRPGIGEEDENANETDGGNVQNENSGEIDATIVLITNRRIVLQDTNESDDSKTSPIENTESCLDAQAAQGRELAMLREARRQSTVQTSKQEKDEAEEEAYTPRLDDDNIINNPPRVRNDVEDDVRRLVQEMGDRMEMPDDNWNHGIEPELPRWPDHDPPEEPEPFNPQDEAVLQDDQVDMEINVALDELLGLRGPLSTLVRNLLWLLAFNATYLGIFAFVPKTVGSAVYSGVFNATVCDKVLKSIPYIHSDNRNETTLLSIISAVNAESVERDTTFRLPDISIVTLGYFSIAAMIVMLRFFWVFTQKCRQRISADTQGRATPSHPHMDDAVRRPRPVDERDEIEESGTTVEVALDATVAVAKVGILLFLKMFVLPLVLGVWLDASTMSIFGHSLSRRIEFAGGDIFSFILLHWVAGITFMLLVTVFLLQLREVAHPELLAGVIRPQEPQPDLLGNLMHETVGTHLKRMFLSLGVYAPLLILHVYLPVKLLSASGLGEYFTFFHLKFWHVAMPQLQIPIELVIFHLSLLALLERYKNTIGGLQHSWMVFMCRRMNLSAHILPHSVELFQLAGTREIFSTPNENETKVDPFWYELAAKEEGIDYFVETNMDKTTVTKKVNCETQSNGELTLDRSVGFFRLPDNCAADDANCLLPARRGRFCLRVGGVDDSPALIEFWEEVRGNEIRRPPEGWDDLGAGGAYVQGRWAWGKEKKSIVEGGVAKRIPFRASEKHPRSAILMLKLAALLFLSWVAITLAILGLTSAPLAVGRSLYHLFRIPEKYIHDPLAFCIGSSVFFPALSVVIKNLKNTAGSPGKNVREWISRFHVPPKRKLVVFLESALLWTAVAPLALGAAYELFFVKSARWFDEKEPVFDVKSVLLCWLVGTTVLNIWAFDSYNDFFTRGFWANFFIAVVEPPEEHRRGAAANAGENGEAENQANERWQGKAGRVAKFFGIWRSILVNWEWDTVDRVALLDNFARPITRQVASALVGSSLSWQFALYLAPLILQVGKGGYVLPFFGLVERGVFRMMLFRLCTVIHVGVQLCLAHRGRIDSWFQVAHEAARDDRYLVGEILMNYDPDDTNFE
eukprot:scaffold443_cov125-Cylindrotheca_fusiformis.AAC.29